MQEGCSGFSGLQKSLVSFHYHCDLDDGRFVTTTRSHSEFSRQRPSGNRFQFNLPIRVDQEVVPTPRGRRPLPYSGQGSGPLESFNSGRAAAAGFSRMVKSGEGNAVLGFLQQHDAFVAKVISFDRKRDDSIISSKKILNLFVN